MGSIRKRIVIVGAGLAGSILAYRLAQQHHVTVIDLAKKPTDFRLPLRDTSWPAGLTPHIGSGLGGTTALWNNGLIELEDDDYRKWPVGPDDLQSYLDQSHFLLSGTQRVDVKSSYETLKNIHVARGIPESLLGQPLFYPQRRRNLWRSLKINRLPVTVIQGRACHLSVPNGQLDGICLSAGDGHTELIPADIAILSAGGLSTPAIVQATSRRYGIGHLAPAGRYYVDHPMGMIATVKLNTKLYDIWNYRGDNIDGTIQTPLVVRSSGGSKGDLKISVFLRPAGLISHGNRRDRVQSVLVNLRNNPLKLSSLMELARSKDDIREIVSFKLGWQLPTDHYVLRLVASEIPTTHQTITSNDKNGEITRDWNLTDTYRQEIHALLDRLLGELGSLVVEQRFFDNWDKSLHTAAHHSGTCRMSSTDADGVCDANGQIHGISNAYICDGSALPSTGYANTGLTIGALALRLSDHIIQTASSI